MHGREYLRCSTCDLVFLHPADRPTREAALAHYATHQNDPSDARYRDFLARLADPLVTRLPAGAHGLDYGSGPGPTLSRMLEERGFRMTLYDPLYAPDGKTLETTYDFLTCTEVAEHFFDTGDELRRMDRLTAPGGWIGIMTSFLEPGQDFGGWRYARDPTHASFYSRPTLAWITRELNWLLEYAEGSRNVVLFRKR